MKEKFIDYCNMHPGLVELIRSTASQRILYDNKLMKKYLLRRAREFNQKKPVNTGLYLETSLTCNSRCIMCKHGYEDMTGIMDMDLYEKIVDQCHEHGMKWIGLHVYGEPLMDEKLFERIEYLRKYDIQYSLCTNGSLLDKEKSQKLLELGGLYHLNFSLNAIEKETYAEITGGLDGELTYANVNQFLDMYNDYNGDKPEVVSVSFVNLKINQAEKKKFVKYWKSKKGISQVGVGDLFKRIGDMDPEKVGRLERMHTQHSDKWMPPCKALWQNLHVYFDGRVAPCYDDLDDRQLIVGDFREETLEDILHGEKLRNLKELHLQDKRHTHEICQNCHHLMPIF